MKPKPYKIISKFFILAIAFLLFQCATLQEIANIQRPVLKLDDVRLSDLSLNDIDLIFEVKIDNPNPMAINLAGFDYDFLLNGNSFISGQENNNLSIAAKGSSKMSIPLSLKFADIYQTYQSVKNQDSTDYKMACGFIFNLPVLGDTRVPVSKSGKLPLIKIPSLKISSLKLEKLTFTRADLNLILNLKNQNNFSFAVKNLNYNFNVNNQSWASGLSQQSIQIQSKASNEISIPISLNFMEMGRTIYNVVIGNQALNYDFQGNMNLNSSIDFLQNIDLPIEKSGQLNIIK